MLPATRVCALAHLQLLVRAREDQLHCRISGLCTIDSRDGFTLHVSMTDSGLLPVSLFIYLFIYFLFLEGVLTFTSASAFKPA